jgi:hypothetical protein
MCTILPAARAERFVAAKNAGWQARFARVAQVAVLNRPCSFTVMTHAAEAALDNLVHSNFIGAGTHLESKLEVAHLATEANAMKPVWENHGPHSFLFCETIQHHVTILSRGWAGKKAKRRG